MVKDNTFVTIQGWMMNLGLTLEETMIYAIIWQFSCDGGSAFVGNRAYLEEWVGKDKSTVRRYLRTLKKKGLVDYDNPGNGKAFCNYRVTDASVDRIQNAPVPHTKCSGTANKIPRSTNDNIDNNIYNNIINSETIAPGAFDFHSALRSLGVTEQTASDWMKVRRKQKASDTKTAFDGLKREIEKSGKTPEECVAYAAANSWRGFKAEWLPQEERKTPKVISTEDYFRMREEGKL